MNARLKVLHQKSKVKQVNLLPMTLVGRSTECDLKIASNLVSRVHCRITVREDAVYIEDLGSANGTFIDGELLKPNRPRAVAPGSKLSVGPAEFLVDYVAVTSSTVVLRRSNDSAKAEPEPQHMDESTASCNVVRTAPAVTTGIPDLGTGRLNQRITSAKLAEAPDPQSQPQSEPNPSFTDTVNSNESTSTTQGLPILATAKVKGVALSPEVAVPVAMPIAAEPVVARVSDAISIASIAEPIEPPLENPFRFGDFSSPKAPDATTPLAAPKNALFSVAPVTSEISPAISQGPNVDFAEFVAPSNEPIDDSPDFNFVDQTEGRSAAKPSAKSDKNSILKSLFSWFVRKPNHAKQPPSPVDDVEETGSNRLGELFNQLPVSEAAKTSDFGFGSTASEPESPKTTDETPLDDDFQGFLKQF